MKAKARLVARGFRQQLSVDYFNTFAPTPTVSSIEGAVAIAVQNDWPLQWGGRYSAGTCPEFFMALYQSPVLLILVCQ